MPFHSCISRSAITAAVVLSAASVHAGVVIPDLTMTVQANSGNVNTFHPAGQPTGSDTWNWNGTLGGNNWGMLYNIDGNADPIVTSNITFTNMTGVTNNYVITVSLPVAPIVGGTVMDGSVGGSVTDANGNGFAQAAALAGSSMFVGLIDGNPAAGTAMLGFPYSATFAGPGSGGTAIIGPQSFGQPIPIGGPNVLSSIGIRLEFSLSAGDSIAMTSFFRVEPVPAPGALGLLGLAGLAGRSRRRR
jgi:MYXO-CTERM domain-containing protein